MTMMDSLRPQPDMAAEFSTLAARDWESNVGASEKTAGKLTVRLEEQKHLKSELLRAKLRGEVCQSDYAEENEKLSNEIRDIEKQLRNIAAATATRDAFVQFCELAIVDIAGVWRKANDDERRRVRQILFSDGILVGANRKLSNPENCSLFSVLAGMTAKKPQLSKVGCPPGIRTPIC